MRTIVKIKDIKEVMYRSCKNEQPLSIDTPKSFDI